MSRHGPLAVLVVHHNSPATLLNMVNDLAGQAFPLSDVTIVDNSVGPGADDLERQLPDGPTLVRVANRGYAAAVNAGAALLRERGWTASDAVLVCTHELRLHPGAVDAMLTALTEPGVVAAAPVLTGFRGRDGRIWSAGGTLSRWGMVPSHRLCGSPVSSVDTRLPPYDVAWADGACVAYRLGTLWSEPLDERFFLYFEEVELHRRLRRRGRIVVVPGARVGQSTGGTPPYYLLRNYLLLTRGQAPRWQRAVGCAFLVTRWLPSLRHPGEIASLVRGVGDYRSKQWGRGRAA